MPCEARRRKTAGKVAYVSMGENAASARTVDPEEAHPTRCKECKTRVQDATEAARKRVGANCC
jgi:hypothetical protein